MAFSYRETQIVKGMLARGDKQHDVASFFGVNGGRVGEVSSGNCDYPNAQPFSDDKLLPPGPYVGAKTVFEIKEILSEAITLIVDAGDGSEDSQVAIDALNSSLNKL